MTDNSTEETLHPDMPDMSCGLLPTSTVSMLCMGYSQCSYPCDSEEGGMCAQYYHECYNMEAMMNLDRNPNCMDMEKGMVCMSYGHCHGDDWGVTEAPVVSTPSNGSSDDSASVTLTVPLDVDLSTVTPAELAGIKDALLKVAADLGGFLASDVERIELVQDGEVVTRRRRATNSAITARIIFKDTATVDVAAVVGSLNKAIAQDAVTVTVTIGGEEITTKVVDLAVFVRVENSDLLNGLPWLAGAMSAVPLQSVLVCIPLMHSLFF